MRIDWVAHVFHVSRFTAIFAVIANGYETLKLKQNENFYL